MQSSWTKEVNSSQATSAKDQISKHSDSTCAHLCSKAETSTKLPVTSPKDYQQHGDQSGMHEFVKVMHICIFS